MACSTAADIAAIAACTCLIRKVTNDGRQHAAALAAIAAHTCLIRKVTDEGK